MRDLKYQQGFGVIPILIVTLVMIAGGLVFYKLKDTSDNTQVDKVPSLEITSQKENGNPDEKFYESSGQKPSHDDSEYDQALNPYLKVPCISNPKVVFTNDFTDGEKISSVEPTIITPGNSRHRAWLNISSGKVPVYAPVDSELVNGVYKNARGALDYDLHFQVSCEIWYLINHITEPVDKIKNAFPSTPQTDTRENGPFKQSIKVKAGELLGYTTGTPTAHNFDFGVFDLKHENAGLPADKGSNYGKEKNFICPFDVLPESVKKSYYAKIIAAEKPYSNCKVF
jgi:hypothetical protein